VDERLESVGRSGVASIDERLGSIEERLSRLASDVAQLTRALDATPAPVHREQERLRVEDAAAKPRKSRARAAKG
jgi:hypothetical protein